MSMIRGKDTKPEIGVIKFLINKVFKYLLTFNYTKKHEKREGKMNTKQLLDRITINPEVMVGKPTIRGLRITVEQILKALAGGITIQELLEDYPELEPEDIQAVLLYAAELVGEEQVFEVGTGA
jgi:uncharacterized protein (DUF433 family)